MNAGFPGALLLIPAGVLSVFLLNSVRIAVLLLIGKGCLNLALAGLTRLSLL
jgi:hypothetical protein